MDTNIVIGCLVTFCVTSFFYFAILNEYKEQQTSLIAFALGVATLFILVGMFLMSLE